MGEIVGVIRVFSLIDPTKFEEAAKTINDAWKDFLIGDVEAADALQNEFIEMTDYTECENVQRLNIERGYEPFVIRKDAGLEESKEGHLRVMYNRDSNSKLFTFMNSLMYKFTNYKEPKVDNINPAHYRKCNMEAIDVIETFTEDLQGIEATDTGNILKYVMRWKNKNGVEDLKKARWYLEHLIAKLEKGDADGN